MIRSELKPCYRVRMMDVDPKRPEWVIRQGLACVWVCATSVEEAVEVTAKRLGHMGGWKIGPDLDQQVFTATERRKEAGKPFW